MSNSSFKTDGNNNLQNSLNKNMFSLATTTLHPLKPHMQASSCISEESPNLFKPRVLERKFSWKCNNIFFHLQPTSRHLHPLQVENCDSNSRLVVDEDYNGKGNDYMS